MVSKRNYPNNKALFRVSESLYNLPRRIAYHLVMRYVYILVYIYICCIDYFMRITVYLYSTVIYQNKKVCVCDCFSFNKYIYVCVFMCVYLFICSLWDVMTLSVRKSSFFPSKEQNPYFEKKRFFHNWRKSLVFGKRLQIWVLDALGSISI